MNSDIDLNHFGPSGSAPGSVSSKHLVSPPRRIISRFLVPLVLLVAFLAVGAYSFRESFVRPTEVMVTLPIVASDDLQQAIVRDSKVKAPAAATRQSLFQAPGWIEPEPYPIIIPSLRTGSVESINVIEGQNVTSGTVIAKLIDEDARLAVQSAEANLALKEAKYEEALNTFKNPTNLVESLKMATATGEKLQAEARGLQDMIKLADIEARIGSTLTRGGYEASLETLKKQTELSASKAKLAETHAQIQLNSATLSAAKERLSLRIDDRAAVDSARAELMEARAALETAQLSHSRSVIRATTSGTIMRLMASPGSMMSSDMPNGMSVATMYKPDHLQVRVDVPLGEAAKVIPGLKAEIQVEAMPDKKFQGELINIVPEFDLQKNVLPVKVRIDRPVAALRPEMIARVEFFQTEIDSGTASPVSDEETSSTTTAPSGAGDILLIPEDVIIEQGEKSYVMVAGPDGQAHRREVAVAPASNKMLAVSEGLNAADKIIASPGSVQPGAQVHIKGIVEHGSH